MKKYNLIHATDQFGQLASIIDNINRLYDKGNYPPLIEDIHSKLIDFAGYDYMKAIEFRKHFVIIQDFSEKFFDCKDDGFSYQLGCRYQKIDFDFPQNIDAEIKWLRGLLKIYDKKFKKEIKIIMHLIDSLVAFKPKFEKYYNS